MIKGRFEAAIPILRRVIKRSVDPRWRDLLAGEVFKAFFLLGDFKMAAIRGEALLGQAAGDRYLPFLCAPITGDLKHFRTRYMHRLRTLPAGNLWYSYFTGFVSDNLVDFDPILARYDQDYLWMRIQVGRRYLEHSRTKRAIELFEEAIARDPQNWRTVGLLAEAHLYLGDVRGAFSAFDAADKELENGAQLLCWRGEICLWLGKYEEALRLLDHACAGGAEWSYCWRGAAKISLGKIEEGTTDLRRALEYEPEDNEAKVWLGEAERLSGRFDEAIKILKSHRANVWALCNEGLANLANGNIPAGRVLFDLLPAILRQEARQSASFDEVGEAPATSVEMARVFTTALKLARGYRRADRGGDPGWSKILPIVAALREQ